MNTRQWIIVCGLVGMVALAVLALTAGLTGAHESNQESAPQESAGVTATASGAIPIQGRLTNAGGSPLSGTFSIMFRLYETELGGTAVCTDTRSVSVMNGLFSDYMDGCYDDITGQKLWLGVKVGSDSEMTPRQLVMPVPYAISLVPGAVISGAGYPILHVESTNTSGRALRAYASATSGTNYGVVGASSSPNGYGGYFYDTDGGVGLYGQGTPGVIGEGYGSLGAHGVLGRAGALGAGVKGEGNMFSYGGWFTTTVQPAVRAESDGVALQLAGSGRIESTAQSHLWISGNGVRPYRQSDSTIIDMDTVGGAKISPGITVTNKNIMLPIAITGPLYGQTVRVSGMDIYWAGSSTFDGISAVLLRRQTGVCESSSCYATILHDSTDQVCDTGTHSAGCTLHFDLSANNVLTANSGILYLTLELGFGGTSGWVNLGGVRLTLEHD